MKNGIETRILVLRWPLWQNEKGASSAGSWGDLTQNQVKMHSLLGSALQQINADGWRVVASLPIQQGAYYGTGLENVSSGVKTTWGGGYGWGTSATSGSALILQRDIDDAGSEAAAERAKQYAKELENSARAWEIRYSPIEQRTKKTGMFSTVTEFVFGDEAFETLEAAEAARSKYALSIETGA